MSIFGTIMSKIFGHNAAAPGSAPWAPPAGANAQPTTTAPAPATAAPARMSEVDVEAILTDMASKYSHEVNWRYSIVDLMAMLGIDNSLAQRKSLATELGYTGDMSDSATMNIWLHKEVMRKLEENGGKVPADLLK
ncbi:MAG: DUF3597 domain-containing protein [Gemmatimonadota bacterium]|nr:DUF3597 domain-containing protein [Gemmatimonadota bacterium]